MAAQLSHVVWYHRKLYTMIWPLYNDCQKWFTQKSVVLVVTLYLWEQVTVQMSVVHINGNGLLSTCLLWMYQWEWVTVQMSNMCVPMGTGYCPLICYVCINRYMLLYRHLLCVYQLEQNLYLWEQVIVRTAALCVSIVTGYCTGSSCVCTNENRLQCMSAVSCPMGAGNCTDVCCKC